eukprot:TRINITY_DN25711_c0_g1_i1.p1 TRINITY_DN25711_c0_g1~~TRINITY_DN25711_c0_g1_i1.p1  ORF type:complete len:495 (-),score=110.68 TRINITY_DN25711_c0_g1_i1:44-1528(-)
MLGGRGLMTIGLYVSVLILALLVSQMETADLKYVVFMDAGSTGTRIYVYTYPASSKIPLLLIGSVNETRLDYRVRPGLATFGKNLSAIPEYLTPLLDFATKSVPQNQQATTPLYLTGTAGFRIINSSESDAIMAVTQQFFQKSKFLFKFTRVITGQEEGAFGWVSVNYLSNKLGRPPSETVTGMDLGGASTQISFYSDDPAIPVTDKFSVRFNGYTYNLYTHSYLYFGQDQYRLQVLNHLVALHPDSTSIDNPCYFTGYQENFTTIDNQLIQFNGTSDFDACESIQKSIMGIDNKTLPNTGMRGVYQPKLNNNYAIAFSAFYRNIESLFLGKTQSPSLQQIEDLMKTNICRMDWEQAKSYFSAVGEESIISGYCMIGTYIELLLADAYGFAKTTTGIVFLGDTNGNTFEYPLGAVMYYENLNVNLIDESECKGSEDNSHTVAWVIGIIVVALVCFAAGIIALAVFQTFVAKKSSKIENDPMAVQSAANWERSLV